MSNDTPPISVAVSFSPLMCRVHLPIFLTLRTWGTSISHTSRHNTRRPASTRHLILICPRAFNSCRLQFCYLTACKPHELDTTIYAGYMTATLISDQGTPLLCTLVLEEEIGWVVNNHTRLPPASIKRVLSDRALPVCQCATYILHARHGMPCQLIRTSL